MKFKFGFFALTVVSTFFFQSLSLKPLFAQENLKFFPNKYEFKLTEDGNVPADFWSYQLPISVIQSPITFIETNINLLEQKPIDLNQEEDIEENKPRPHIHHRVGGPTPTPFVVTKNRLETDTQKVEDLIEILKKNGIED